MYGLLGNLFALALSLAPFRFATLAYTVLMSSNKNETPHYIRCWTCFPDGASVFCYK